MEKIQVPWVFVPLQYLFCIWRAQANIAKAAAAAGTPKHGAYLAKAAKAVVASEIMQQQFVEVTNWIDIRRNSEALRSKIAS